MTGVVVIAPPDATWAASAEAMLKDARVHVARTHELRVAGLLVLAGGVSAVLVDRRCIDGTPPAQLERLRSLSQGTKIVVIGDPFDLAEVRAVIGVE